MAIHELRSDPQEFTALNYGRQTYLLRRKTQDFQVGDTLILHETQHSQAEMDLGADLVLTGDTISILVIGVQEGPKLGICPGWCCMSVLDADDRFGDALVLRRWQDLERAKEEGGEGEGCQPSAVSDQL